MKEKRRLQVVESKLVSYLAANGRPFMLQSHPQRRLIPCSKFFLLYPSPAFFLNLHIKVPEDTRQDGSNFEICESEHQGHVRKYYVLCYSPHMKD